MKKPHIAIAGAGIGGLTAAALLTRSGYPCTVFEQAPKFRRVGAGINFAPNATRVFRQLGLEKRIGEVAIRPKTKVNRTWDSGRVLREISTQDLVGIYGAPFFAMHRGSLHDVLISAVDPGIIRTGKRVSAVRPRGAEVVLEFDDRSTATADAVVGADGLHSRVRDSILAPEGPRYVGLVAYRAIFPTTSVSDLHLPDNTRWLTENVKDGYVLFYFMSEARNEVNVVAVRPEEWGNAEYVPVQVPAQQLAESFAGYHPDVLRQLRACTDVSRWPLLVRPPRRPWHVGCVALLGDACHATTPHMGQGGGMAVEDAAMLVRCLDSVPGHDPEEAFRLYEQNRFNRVTQLQQVSETDSWSYGAMSHEWLYGYDVTSALIEPAVQGAGARI